MIGNVFWILYWNIFGVGIVFTINFKNNTRFMRPSLVWWNSVGRQFHWWPLPKICVLWKQHGGVASRSSHSFVYLAEPVLGCRKSSVLDLSFSIILFNWHCDWNRNVSKSSKILSSRIEDTIVATEKGLVNKCVERLGKSSFQIPAIGSSMLDWKPSWTAWSSSSLLQALKQPLDRLFIFDRLEEEVPNQWNYEVRGWKTSVKSSDIWDSFLWYGKNGNESLVWLIYVGWI